ncbi:MAG: Sir2 family NAD-dependent protein deacetylase [Desulfobacteraceae bacterium]
MDHHRLKQLLAEGLNNERRVTVLTGAGISAESGIPTFRGPEGYWTIGSRVYQPQEMATLQMFRKDPRSVWQWYLYRLGVCRQADPNPGHFALADMEHQLPGQFTLVTQNVDNLHRKAGQSSDSTYEIHGNIHWVRCAANCGQPIMPLPDPVSVKKRDEPISDDEWQSLHCPRCRHLLRPHVLWFDESYNEEHYRYESTLDAGRQTGLLIVVGTSGATNLPNQLVAEVYHRSGVIIDINIASNLFGKLAERYERGMVIRQPSGIALPQIAQQMTALLTSW